MSDIEDDDANKSPTKFDPNTAKTRISDILKRAEAISRQKETGTVAPSSTEATGEPQSRSSSGINEYVRLKSIHLF
ncbi:hypothetical protein Ciccas_000355 [Cichlidogyrus casuarinus]|uniref:Uncharacterized protein n=1 Tax=Cichlidogyrus casuarinus TaxID=1844966 RepID=A0ABD2QNJ4_9PLAT